MAEVQHTRTVVCSECDFICRLHSGPEELPADICALAHDMYCPKAKKTHAAAIDHVRIRVKFASNDS